MFNWHFLILNFNFLLSRFGRKMTSTVCFVLYGVCLMVVASIPFPTNNKGEEWKVYIPSLFCNRYSCNSYYGTIRGGWAGILLFRVFNCSVSSRKVPLKKGSFEKFLEKCSSCYSSSCFSWKMFFLLCFCQVQKILKRQK